ncbi:large conductance mechanosensitive channel protein MscL [Siphonobacter aquaeclarae]|uniref:Large-conductance mechanosensitive channel n=1 Tax=Siphonobacter aquaeclarae TaxID=563176 RepID=A0A1G9W8X1_9BACT|nr:large conductance mechanosensitive channel protein MscL [Siphonobacter aquaeclarae]MBO9637322.1 large conductance mechanosensitive channel protein MscL [Siphonobacter aquaeclarae]SDM80455.1 large conductance mechanosensitive channel [Siphonobacter aquaeclarae]
MLKSFVQFIKRGNVIDLAVGVIIGASFGKIVDSAVNDLIMPLVSIPGDVDFSNLYLPLSKKVPLGLTLAEARKLGPIFAWGNFVTVVVNFFILAFIVFLLVRLVHRLMKKDETQAPPLTKQETLLTEIRDLLKEKETVS